MLYDLEPPISLLKACPGRKGGEPDSFLLESGKTMELRGRFAVSSLGLPPIPQARPRRASRPQGDFFAQTHCRRLETVGGGPSRPTLGALAGYLCYNSSSL